MKLLYQTVYGPSRTIYHPMFYLSEWATDNEWMREKDLEEVVAMRRARLRQVIANKFDGNQASMVRDTGINAGELSGLLRTKSFGEKKARALEAQLGLPAGYLDGEDAMPTGEEWERVVWLWRNADDEVRTMFRLLVGAMYEKKRRDTVHNHHKNKAGSNVTEPTPGKSHDRRNEPAGAIPTAEQ